jgi:hypothetical protein
VHHIAVLHHVFLAFNAQASLVFGAGFAAKPDEIFIRNDLGFDEAFFKIAVDDTCRLRGFPIPLLPSTKGSHQ